MSACLAIVLAATAAAGAGLAPTGAPERVEARITADTTYYDRKEGIVVFQGHVHVDDAEYQMHSEKGYVFLTGTNTLRRVVAVGNVALTNGTRRASGASATYRRDNGLVILRGADGVPAVVSETTAEGETRTVKGRKIRFWVDRGQVEVLEADITAPRPGGGGAGLESLLK